MDVNTAPQGTTVEDIGKKIANLLNPAPAPEPQAAAIPTQPEPENAEAEAAPETPEPETPIAQEKQTHKVRVDGEEIEVDHDELLRGYSRTSVFTRRTQEAAEVRKAAEAELNAAREERQQYAKQLEQIKSQLAQDSEPDWATLVNTDPIEYVRQRAAWDQRKDRLAAINEEQKRVNELKARDEQNRLQAQILEEERKLHLALPDWKDPRKSKAEREGVIDYARSVGFSDAELGSLYDHRALVIMREAYLYRKMVAEAKKTVEKAKDAPKTAKPGNLQSRVVDPNLAAARDRFDKSRTWKDAGAVLAQRLTTRK